MLRDAVDLLHSTATSHHRIIVAEFRDTLSKQNAITDLKVQYITPDELQVDEESGDTRPPPTALGRAMRHKVCVHSGALRELPNKQRRQRRRTKTTTTTTPLGWRCSSRTGRIC